MSPREVICCTSSADCSKSCMSGRGGIVTSPLSSQDCDFVFWMSPPNFDALLLLGEFPIPFYLWYIYIYYCLLTSNYVSFICENYSWTSVCQGRANSRTIFLDAWQILRKTQEHVFWEMMQLIPSFEKHVQFYQRILKFISWSISSSIFCLGKRSCIFRFLFLSNLAALDGVFFWHSLCKQATPLLFIRYYSFWVILDFHVHFSCLIR